MSSTDDTTSENMLDEKDREIEALRAQLRKISWIVNKPRSMSMYLNEAELWRSVVTEVQAVFQPDAAKR